MDSQGTHYIIYSLSRQYNPKPKSPKAPHHNPAETLEKDRGWEGSTAHLSAAAGGEGDGVAIGPYKGAQHGVLDERVDEDLQPW